MPDNLFLNTKSPDARFWLGQGSLEKKIIAFWTVKS